MKAEMKEALLEAILERLGANPEEVKEIDLRIKWAPAADAKAKAKAKEKAEQG